MLKSRHPIRPFTAKRGEKSRLIFCQTAVLTTSHLITSRQSDGKQLTAFRRLCRQPPRQFYMFARRCRDTTPPLGTCYFPSQIDNSTSRTTGLLRISITLRCPLSRQASRCDKKKKSCQHIVRAFQVRRLSAMTPVPDKRCFKNPQQKKREYGIGKRVHMGF